MGLLVIHFFFQIALSIVVLFLKLNWFFHPKEENMGVL